MKIILVLFVAVCAWGQRLNLRTQTRSDCASGRVFWSGTTGRVDCDTGVTWDNTNRGMRIVRDSVNAASAYYSAPLLIWNNPATIAAGEAAGLYINIANQQAATPGVGDAVGATIRVTNDANYNHQLWGMNVMAIQDFAPTAATAIRGAEIEIANKSTSLTTQLDPWGGAVGPISTRSNGIEISGHGGSTYRNSAALAVWANSQNADAAWFDTGVALSRISRHGIIFRQNPGSAVGDPNAFSVCAICEESNSTTSMRILGTHTNIVDISSATSVTNMFNLGALAAPAKFISATGGQVINFDSIRLVVRGPNGEGSGFEIAKFQSFAGVEFAFRQQAAAGTMEAGTTGNHNLSFMVNSTRRIHVDATTGNVGISTDGPLFPLHVPGRVALGAPITAPTDADLGNNQCSMWNNAGTLTFRCRDNAGALFTKTL